MRAKNDFQTTTFGAVIDATVIEFTSFLNMKGAISVKALPAVSRAIDFTMYYFES
jgi:hypothetical protein